MSDAAHNRTCRVLTVGALRRALAECHDEAIVDFGTTMSGMPLRWYRFVKDPAVFQFELLEDIDDDLSAGDRR